jgi:tripartite-type tricarboxylate transporter receptor subunit TctC
MNRSPFMFLLALALWVFAPGVLAFPERPIRLVVPWATGGSTDALARAVGQRMSATLGQEVLIENRPGAAGTVGIGQVAKAAADGYTLAIIELPHAIAPAVLARVPYDLERDFAPISLIGTSALVLFTHSAQPGHDTAGGLMAEARAKPGTVVLAHSGNGSLSHLASELLQRRAGAEFNLVPYRGSGPALTDLAGGLVAGHFATLASGSALLTGGRIRAVAVAAERRLPVMPQMPTLAEQGVKDMVLEQWWGLVAPVGTPANAIERIRRELHAALGHASVRERLRMLAIEKQPTSGEDFGRFIRSESTRWQQVAREAGLKPE